MRTIMILGCLFVISCSNKENTKYTVSKFNYKLIGELIHEYEANIICQYTKEDTITGVFKLDKAIVYKSKDKKLYFYLYSSLGLTQIYLELVLIPNGNLISAKFYSKVGGICFNPQKPFIENLTSVNLKLNKLDPAESTDVIGYFKGISGLNDNSEFYSFVGYFRSPLNTFPQEMKTFFRKKHYHQLYK